MTESAGGPVRSTPPPALPVVAVAGGEEGSMPPLGNRWPEGIRRLLCLNCSRGFPSESKMQRLCKACR